MRFLVDNALSPMLAEGLRQAGHDAVHVRDIGMAASLDAAIMVLAHKEHYVLLSADTDFGTLLAKSEAVLPSVILFRFPLNHDPGFQLVRLLGSLSQISTALEQGSIVVFGETGIRIRRLPI